MYEFWIGLIIGAFLGMGLCAWWTIPVLDKYRETIGRLQIDLRYASEGPPPTFETRAVKGRTHNRCGGAIETRTRVSVRPGRHGHGDSAWCRKCGQEGEVFADDGGIDFIWYRAGGRP